MNSFKSLASLVSLAALVGSIWLHDASWAAAAGEQANARGCMLYITGIGCPACAKAEPMILHDWLSSYPGLTLIEYEITARREANRATALQYFEAFTGPDSFARVPFVIMNEENFWGPRDIDQAPGAITAATNGLCPMPDGSLRSLASLRLSQLPGMPRIWTRDRVLIREHAATYGPLSPTRDTCLRNLIRVDDIHTVLQRIAHQPVDPEPVATSGGKIEFRHAVRVGNWRVQWDRIEP